MLDERRNCWQIFVIGTNWSRKRTRGNLCRGAYFINKYKHSETFWLSFVCFSSSCNRAKLQYKVICCVEIYTKTYRSIDFVRLCQCCENLTIHSLLALTSTCPGSVGSGYVNRSTLTRILVNVQISTLQ